MVEDTLTPFLDEKRNYDLFLITVMYRTRSYQYDHGNIIRSSHGTEKKKKSQHYFEVVMADR